MELRELSEADLPALLDLCRRTLPLDSFSLPLLHRRILGEPDRSPAYQLCLWDGAQLAAVLLGGTRQLGDRPALFHRARPEGVLQLFAVEPAYWRRGLATQLLGALEVRMRDDGIGWLRVGNFAPNYFWPGIDVRYTPGLCFLLSRGFNRKGDALNMEVDLLARDWDTSADEARLAAAGFEIRRLLPSDRARFDEWLGAVWGPIWQWEGISTYANDPVSTFVALKDGQICAFASYNTSSFPHLFGPTGTAEQQRWQGLGRVLLYRCLREMRDLGFERAEIGWVGPIQFYARTAGAVINRVFFWLEKEL
jgi:GNAT superfamily N-acetyltransferase